MPDFVDLKGACVQEYDGTIRLQFADDSLHMTITIDKDDHATYDYFVDGPGLTELSRDKFFAMLREEFREG